jgi:hypothetical protein
MRTPWDVDEEDEGYDELDAALTALLVLAIALLCSGLIGLFVGVLWGWMS